MKYFLDNCVSFRFAHMLRALQVDAVALREQHSERIPDIELFRELKDSGYVFITADRNQTTRMQEAQALIESGVTGIFLGAFWPKKQFWDQAVWLVSRWRKIEAFASSVTLGTCAEFRENGRAKPFYP